MRRLRASIAAAQVHTHRPWRALGLLRSKGQVKKHHHTATAPTSTYSRPRECLAIYLAIRYYALYSNFYLDFVFLRIIRRVYALLLANVHLPLELAWSPVAILGGQASRSRLLPCYSRVAAGEHTVRRRDRWGEARRLGSSTSPPRSRSSSTDFLARALWLDNTWWAHQLCMAVFFMDDASFTCIRVVSVFFQ